MGNGQRPEVGSGIGEWGVGESGEGRFPSSGGRPFMSAGGPHSHGRCVDGGASVEGDEVRQDIFFCTHDVMS